VSDGSGVPVVVGFFVAVGLGVVGTGVAVGLLGEGVWEGVLVGVAGGARSGVLVAEGRAATGVATGGVVGVGAEHATMDSSDTSATTHRKDLMRDLHGPSRERLSK